MNCDYCGRPETYFELHMIKYRDSSLKPSIEFLERKYKPEKALACDDCYSKALKEPNK